MADELEAVGYEERPEDILSGLVAASQAAQQLQNRGVRIEPRPIELPPLDVGRLMRMNPVAVANLVRARRAQEQRNLSDEQNYRQLLNAALQQQGEERRAARTQGEYERRRKEVKEEKLEERDNAALEFAEQWADAVEKNKQASKARDEAQQALAQITSFATSQQKAGNVLLGQPAGKPDPKSGLYAVPFTFNIPTEDPVTGKPYPTPGLKARNEAASILNSEFEKRTKAFNEAMEEFRKREAETKDLFTRTRNLGYFVEPGGRALADLKTRKTYRLPAVQPAPGVSPMGQAPTKRFIYNPSNPGQLTPVR